MASPLQNNIIFTGTFQFREKLFPKTGLVSTEACCFICSFIAIYDKFYPNVNISLFFSNPISNMSKGHHIVQKPPALSPWSCAPCTDMYSTSTWSNSMISNLALLDKRPFSPRFFKLM